MTRRTALLAAMTLVISLLPATSEAAWTYDMFFPVIPDPGYSNNFGDPRSGGRSHAGIDIMSPKMTPVVAVASGTIGWMHNEQGGDCCALELNHDDGYESWYIHLNNDTPGTDDGNGWGFAPGIERGVHVEAGQLIGYVGDSGNAESSGSHLHFELHAPDGSVINPYTHLNAATRLPVPIDGEFEGPFWDDEGSIHEDNINRLADLGITAGCDDLQYCPAKSVTRGQMATFLTRMLGLTPSGVDWFDDDDGDVHEGAINALADHGISNTCGKTSYCAGDPITRNEMAFFMANAYDLPASSENPFNDITPNHYKAEIRALAAAGITSGCSTESYCPNNPVSRAQMASFLIRAVDWLAVNG